MTILLSPFPKCLTAVRFAEAFVVQSNILLIHGNIDTAT